jgi:hypothetical protein
MRMLLVKSGVASFHGQLVNDKHTIQTVYDWNTKVFGIVSDAR